MSETKERLLQFLRYKGIGQQKFEISIGMSNGWVNKVGDSIRENTLQKIKGIYPELNIAWLKSGVGEMLNSEQSIVGDGNTATQIKGDNNNAYYTTNNYRGCGGIDRKAMNDIAEMEDRIVILENNAVSQEIAYTTHLLPVSAQGGSLNDFVVSVKDSDCEKIISPIKGADFAMSVSGDSMAPEYPAGAQIFIKKVNERAFIEWGKTYVLDTCNGSVIKILVPSNKDGYVKCVSINKDQIYAPFEIAWEDIFGVYRVLLCMSVK